MSNRSAWCFRAVSGDDWSSVIDEQTQETVVPPVEEAAATPILSPFRNGTVQENSGAFDSLSWTAATLLIGVHSEVALFNAFSYALSFILEGV
jgi:hypothetical protein